MSNVIIEELIEMTAAVEDVNPIWVSYVFTTEFHNDIDKVEEAARAAAIAVKAGLTELQLINLVEWAYDVDGQAFFNFIGIEYFSLWESDTVAQYELLTTGWHDGFSLHEMREAFNEQYYGYYQDEASFAEIYTTETANEAERQILERLDTAGAIDWQQLWDNTLRHEWFTTGGYYFRESTRQLNYNETGVIGITAMTIV
jgi:hypothetical protein